VLRKRRRQQATKGEEEGEGKKNIEKEQKFKLQ
jgi:hypothetical protein